MACRRYYLLKCSSIIGPKAALNTCQPKSGEAYQSMSSDFNSCSGLIWKFIKISRTVCLIEILRGIYTYVTWETGFQKELWGSLMVSACCAGGK